MLRVPFVGVDSVPGSLGELDRLGLTTVALTTEADAVALDEVGEIERPRPARTGEWAE